MASNVDKLRREWERLDKAAVKLSGEHQSKVQKAVADLKDEYHDRIWDANRAAAAAQKEYLDAEAAQALVGRDDARETADRLGLTLPD